MLNKTTSLNAQSFKNMTKSLIFETEPNYSGGIILDHSDPSRLVLSRSINGVFEIEIWTTPNDGLTW